MQQPDEFVPMHQPRAERRAARSRRRAIEGVCDAAELSQGMADAGLISQEAAQESKDMAERVAEKLGANNFAFTRDQLKSIIERIEHLEEEKAEIADQVKEVYAEAKGNGFDVTALKTIVRLRKQDAAEREERETILETYMLALGMI